MSETSPARTRSAIDVFKYLDHRAFLADYYKAKKRRGFSYRAFSRSAGLGAPNYLKLVIDGSRKLTPPMAARFATACGLSGDAAEYFVELVGFNHASAVAERNRRHQRLLAFRRYRQAHKLDSSQAAYHATWYLPAIRELAASPAFRDDPRWIAGALWPPIKVNEAKQALDTLVALGLLGRDTEGRLHQQVPVVSTGAEVQKVHIANYHGEMMARAMASIDLVPPQQRDLSALTLCVGPTGLQRLKQRIQELRRELIELTEVEADRGQVVQLNLQLFPLSHLMPAAAPRKRTAARKSPSEDPDDTSRR